MDIFNRKKIKELEERIWKLENPPKYKLREKVFLIRWFAVGEDKVDLSDPLTVVDMRYVDSDLVYILTNGEQLWKDVYEYEIVSEEEANKYRKEESEKA